MQVEHVAGVGFAAWRTTQQQRDLAIGPGLLGQIVINDQRVHAAIAEVLAHGATGIGCDELGRGRVGSGRRNHDGVFHRAVLGQFAHYVGDGRSLLADRDVDAEHVLPLLVDDGIHRHRRLAGLAIANDQLALAATDRNHRVDGLEAGLHRLRHRLAPDHAGGDLFDLVGDLGIDRALAVDRLAQRIDHAAEQLGADRYLENAAGTLDGIAFGNVLVVTQDHGADRVALQVQGEAEGVAGELQHFTLHHVGQAMDAADAVRH